MSNRVKDNMKLVTYIVDKYFSKFPNEREDLIQEGYKGLIVADKTFDEEKAQFSTFAYKCIVCSIDKYVKRYMYKHKRNKISLNTELKSDKSVEDNPYEVFDVLKSEEKIHERLLYNELRNEMIRRASSQGYNQKRKRKDIDNIVKLKVIGYNQTEIGKKLGYSQRYVWLRLEECKAALNEMKVKGEWEY